MFVIGTAGHVDHGKSSLVQALTGIDPDRLREEKERGMTIDLGFAWLALPDGSEVSIVDVPGHERFIKSMVAGVGGIDLALLIVAADEGVMPQTREHLAILDLLGVSNGIVVITKRDLVDADWLSLVLVEVEEVLAGTCLEGSPMVCCSATTREGLDELIGLIEAKLSAIPPKRDLGRPRLSIDRVFTMAGFGTVVTGTLIDGVFRVGQEVEILPVGSAGRLRTLASRIRGLQTHRRSVEEAYPGTRTAINLAGVEPQDLARGQVVTSPGWLRPSMAVDVQLRALDSLARPLRHNLKVTFQSHASETGASIRLLELDELLPGEETWAQMRLFKPLPLLKSDRFIIRDANDTLGGGVVVETHARQHARRREAVIGALKRQAGGDPVESVYGAIAAAEPVELKAALAQTSLTAEEAAEAVDRLVADRRIVTLMDGTTSYALTDARFARLRGAAKTAIDSYLAEHPLRRGIGKEELRSRLELPQRLFAPALGLIAGLDDLVDIGALVTRKGWEPRLTPAQRTEADAFLATLKANPFAPEIAERPSEDIVRYLLERGDVVDCGAGVIFTTGAFDEMTERVVAMARKMGPFKLADVRDLLGSSRRYVQPFLEELDHRRVTLRRADMRVVHSSLASEPAH